MSDYEVGVPGCGPASFRWSQRCGHDAVVVSLAGELDVASVELEPLLLRIAESGPAPTIVLDMSELDYIDAHCVGVIVGAWKAAKARGRVLQVNGLHGLPARLFRLVGLEPMLARRPDGDVPDGNAGDR
jgi:anti-anti-sigma factor